MKHFDIFPLNFNFNIKDSNLLKTVWGGIFSVLFGLTSIALVIFNLYSYLKNQSPIILISQDFIGDKPAQEFNISNLQIIPFFFSDERLYVFDIIPDNLFFNSYNMNDTNSSNSLIIGKTDYCSNVNDNISMTLTNIYLDPKKSLCLLKYNSIDKIELGGSLVSTQQIRDINFTMKFDLSSDKNFSFISGNLTNLNNIPYYFSFIFNNYHFDLNLSQGNNEFLDYQEKRILAGEDQIVEILLQKNLIYSDDNYLFNFYPKKIYQFYTYSDINIYSTPRMKDPKIASFTFRIHLDKNQITYYRSYMKLDQLLANTMSILSVLLLVFENLTKLFEYKSVEYFLMKKLYYFNSKKNYRMIKLRKESLIKNMKKNTNLNLMEIELDDHSEKNDLNQIVVIKSIENKNHPSDDISKFKQKDNDEWREIIEGTKPSNLKIKKIFLEVCPCKSISNNENMLKINRGEEMLLYDLNIVIILKKLIEFEKFKEILFNRNQIDLMNVFHIRKIDSTMELKDLLKKKLYEMKCDKNISINELSKAYESCLCSAKKIDKKIVQNLHFNN